MLGLRARSFVLKRDVESRQLCQESLQLLFADRLGDVIVKAHLNGSSAVFLLAVAGDGDEIHRRKLRQRVNTDSPIVYGRS